MKKIIILILVLGLSAAGFFIYNTGFNTSFKSDKIEGKTYEEIKKLAEEENLDQLNIEDIYLLAKKEDDEKYYRLLYKAYEKEDPDLAMQYLYDEYVEKANKKVYPILKEEAKSDVSFTATETAYNKALKNLIDGENLNRIGDSFLFIPKYYDSKTKDQGIYSFEKENYIPQGLAMSLDPDNGWTIIHPYYIDENGKRELNMFADAFQTGSDKIYFKNFDGKTILAFSMADNAFPSHIQDRTPVLQQTYIYKDYLLRVILSADYNSESYDEEKYRNMGIGGFDASSPDVELRYFKGSEEISKEDFESNVLPLENLLSLSKEESKTWMAIPTQENSNGETVPNEISPAHQNKINNLVLYTYNISLSQDSDLPYLKPYLKHLYTNLNSDLLLDSSELGDENSEKCFYANVCDLDKDKYPEIIMNYVMTRDGYFVYHTKVIAYDPEAKSTYSLGDFVSYDLTDDGGFSANAGTLFEKSGKTYLAVLKEEASAASSSGCISLYEKVGNELVYVDSSARLSYMYDGVELLGYPEKGFYKNDEIYYMGQGVDGSDYRLYYEWPMPDTNSDEKFEDIFKRLIAEDIREEVYDPYDIILDQIHNREIGNSNTSSDIEEIKDILLANKMLDLPSYKRVCIGDLYYPAQCLISQEGKDYIDVRVLNEIEDFKLDENIKVLKKDEEKYLALEDLKKMGLVESESSSLIVLKN